jgi:hypothetical protein
MVPVGSTRQYGRKSPDSQAQLSTIRGNHLLERAEEMPADSADCDLIGEAITRE